MCRFHDDILRTKRGKVYLINADVCNFELIFIKNNLHQMTLKMYDIIMVFVRYLSLNSCKKV